ncbi:unnamed protein product, partial [Didymodactylos carnosus]
MVNGRSPKTVVPQDDEFITVIQPRDKRGCDGNFPPSCGPKGKCCDWHDECYAKNKCKANSWG